MKLHTIYIAPTVRVSLYADSKAGADARLRRIYIHTLVDNCRSAAPQTERTEREKIVGQSLWPTIAEAARLR